MAIVAAALLHGSGTATHAQAGGPRILLPLIAADSSGPASPAASPTVAQPGIAGTVLTAGAGRAGIHVYACPIPPGECGYALTGPDGTYVVRVRDGNYRVQFGRTSAGASPDGFYSSTGFTTYASSSTLVTVAGTLVANISVDFPVNGGGPAASPTPFIPPPPPTPAATLSPTASATPVPSPLPAGRTYEFEDGIDAATRMRLTRIAEDAGDFLAQISGVTLTRWTWVQAQTPEFLAQWYSRLQGITIERARETFATSRGFSSSRNKVPFALGYAADAAEQSISHEEFHFLQAQLAGDLDGVVDRATNWGPRWLIEGCANWFQAKYGERAGLFTYDSALQASRQATSGFPAKLVELESWNGMLSAGTDRSYSLGFVACDMIVRERGVAAVVEYWRVIGFGTPWSQAFQTAFSESVPQFYSRFETSR